MIREWPVAASDDGERLDRFLAARAATSRAAARRAIDQGCARINGRPARKGQTLREGDRVSVEGPLGDRAALAPAPEPEAPLAVLHEDAEVVALAKPAGTPTHPLRAGERGTLAGALVARFPECASAGDDPREAGFVQRLDIDTSGAILAARSMASWHSLRRAFRDGAVEKEYLALVVGALAGEGAIDLPLGHDPRDRRRVIAVADPAEARRLGARPSLTRWSALATRGGTTLLRVLLSTGRMHQIRAHLASVGHPIVGDALYGGPPPLEGAPGHLLHASRVRAPHPAGGVVDVSAPLPPDRLAALLRLGFEPALLQRREAGLD